MKYSIAVIAFAATVLAADSTDDLLERTPEGDAANPPGGASSSFPAFTIKTTPVGEGHDYYNTTCVASGLTKYWLFDTKLVDQCGRTGSIVANKQYQFDGPPQENAEITKGFYLLSNGSLALGDTTTFYKCTSGDFGNLYSEAIETSGDQCKPVRIDTYPCQDLASVPHPHQRGRGENLPPVQNVNKDCPLPSGTASETYNFMKAMPTAEPSSATSGAPVYTQYPVPQTTSATTPSTPDTTTPAPIAPIVNATNPIATGTAAQPPSPTGATSAPSPFTGAGAIVAAGQKVVLAIAGVAAFALF